MHWWDWRAVIRSNFWVFFSWKMVMYTQHTARRERNPSAAGRRLLWAARTKCQSLAVVQRIMNRCKQYMAAGVGHCQDLLSVFTPTKQCLNELDPTPVFECLCGGDHRSTITFPPLSTNRSSKFLLSCDLNQIVPEGNFTSSMSVTLSVFQHIIKHPNFNLSMTHKVESLP